MLGSRRFQTAINRKDSGHVYDPGGCPATSFNRYNEFALYANDNWRVGNRVTVNLGVR